MNGSNDYLIAACSVPSAVTTLQWCAERRRRNWANSLRLFIGFFFYILHFAPYQEVKDMYFELQVFEKDFLVEELHQMFCDLANDEQVMTTVRFVNL